MKKNNGLGIVIFMAYMGVVVFLQKTHPNAVYVLAGIMGTLFLFSMVVRNKIAFKPYFTSKYNFFTSKIIHQRTFDLPKDILFDKIIEVLTDAGFKVRHADKAAGTIFATSAISVYSWGENLYLDLAERDHVTTIDFCSACFFGVTSWGRNERNYEHLLTTFEKSLTI